MAKADGIPHLAAAQRRWILASVFLLGFAVLVVEILGTRVISPFFGSSVYVWSSQITVTLAALAVGYLAGGRWADARPTAERYYWQVGGSGLLLLVVPFLKTPVLSVTTSLGLMGGSLVGAAVLFAPALFLMSATGPLAIRLVTDDIPLLGRGVGKVYALSTVGSVLGALVTGFVLVPHFSVRRTFFALGLGLLVLAGLGLRRAGRRMGGTSAVLAALLAALPLLQAPAAVASNVVFHANSLYGDVKVLDVSTVRFLILDGVTHGAVDRATTEPTADYLYQLESLAVMRPTARKALVIGLGAGILPEIFHRHYGIKTDVVEIDAVVADAARTYFGFTPTGVVAVEDGRTFVEHSSESYDIVVLDAFASERAPFHLFTEEFFQRVKARMAPGGVFGVNIICNPEHPAWHSVYKTLAAVFPHVRAFSMAVAEGAVGNMILVASDADIPLPEIARVRAPLRPFVEAMTAHQVPPPSEAASAAAPLLTDDFNPIDHLFRGIMETWRKHILRDNRSVLLYED